jgi:hypothetical protein
MRHKKLCNGIAELVCTNFGLSPVGIERKVGLCSDNLKISPFEIQEGEKTIKYPVWYGEIIGDQILAAAGIFLDGEVFLTFTFKAIDGELDSSLIIGIRFDWNERDSDPGSFMLKKGEGDWLPMDLARKLRVGLGVEDMVQEGSIWRPGNFPDRLRKCLASMIELDIEKSL